ncbi:hypothetical protein [Haloplanus halobius]|uniref:hypothetical protein n=1 Tax=Haloplanus halobius TaxID=2934938 RepID=UPI00200D8DBE|nr:hypothetical protein [Haloplanus sp. XH21]
MRRETVIIVLLIASVLLPMWYVALTSGTPGSSVGLGVGEDPVAVNPDADIDPTGKFLPTPVEVGPNQSGVITWVALLGAVAGIVSVTRFVDRIGHARQSVVESETETDGGKPVVKVPPYLQTDTRWIVDYWPAPADRTGLLALAGLSWCTVVFAGLLASEGLGEARNQFIGTYAGMLFLSLAATVLVYAVFFVPSITVAERRDHQ